MGLSLEESLSPAVGTRTIEVGEWRARLTLVGEGYVSMPPGAGRIDIWIDGDKVAIIAWTRDKAWAPHIKRGSWESEHFDQRPYKTSAERWVEICSARPDDYSVLALMRQARPDRPITSGEMALCAN
jgi:hypothetical protein